MTAQEKKKVQVKLVLKKLGNDGKLAGEEPVHELISSSEAHAHVLYQAVRAYQANQRLGTAAVKDRSEVSGGGKKPWKQKGTGRARHGSTRSPIWAKGGVVFGPEGKNFKQDMPKSIRRTSLIAGLKRKAEEGNLYVVEQFASKDGKTKAMAAWTGALPLKKPLVITDAHDPKTHLSVRNIPTVSLKTAREAHVYDLLSARECVLTRQGYQKLLERLQK